MEAHPRGHPVGRRGLRRRGGMDHRLVASRDRGDDRRRRQHLDRAGHRGRGTVTGQRPRPQPTADEQAQVAASPDHDTVGQLAGVNGPGDLTPCPVDPLAVQYRVHLAGPRPAGQPLRRLPCRGETEEIGAAAVATRPVPGGQRGRLIEKEQRRPPARRHRIAPDTLPVQHAADPRLRSPVANAQLTALPVQTATIAHHQATGRIHDDLARRQHPVLQRHGPILHRRYDIATRPRRQAARRIPYAEPPRRRLRAGRFATTIP
jgi:hypothetical protein